MSKKDNTIKATVEEIAKTGNKKYSEQRLKKDILDVLKNSLSVNEYDQESISSLSKSLEKCLSKFEELGIKTNVKYGEIEFDTAEYDENQDRLINLIEQYDNASNTGLGNELSDDV